MKPWCIPFTLLVTARHSVAFTHVTERPSLSRTPLCYGAITSSVDHSKPYTGGPEGSSMIAVHVIDKDAPWGSENPNLRYGNAVHLRKETGPRRPGEFTTDPPCTTGGVNGSTFVSDWIDRDSIFTANYHEAQQYLRHQQLKEDPSVVAEEDKVVQEQVIERKRQRALPRANFSSMPAPRKKLELARVPAQELQTV